MNQQKVCQFWLCCFEIFLKRIFFHLLIFLCSCKVIKNWIVFQTRLYNNTVLRFLPIICTLYVSMYLFRAFNVLLWDANCLVIKIWQYFPTLWVWVTTGTKSWELRWGGRRKSSFNRARLLEFAHLFCQCSRTKAKQRHSTVVTEVFNNLWNEKEHVTFGVKGHHFAIFNDFLHFLVEYWFQKKILHAPLIYLWALFRVQMMIPHIHTCNSGQRLLSRADLEAMRPPACQNQSCKPFYLTY